MWLAIAVVVFAVAIVVDEVMQARFEKELMRRLEAALKEMAHKPASPADAGPEGR